MAEAAADLSTGENLEQKILQVLSEAGSPVKIAQLVKKCHVPKKTLNKVLYHLKEEGKVSLEAPATWCLGGDAPGDEVSAVPKDLTAHPSLDERVFRFLEDNGPQKALHIAKALGMKTAKEVNPHLYKMRDRHLLSYDGQTWMIYGPSQKSQELGPRPHHPLPLPVSEDPSSQDPRPGAWGDQHIHMEKSMLRRVQLGHGNEMSVPREPVEHSAYSFTGSPPVSATTADQGTSFTMQTPEPGADPEGNTAQRVHIKSCLLEDATIGNSNKMTIHTMSEGGVTESGDSKEPKEDTDSSSKAVPRGNCSHTSNSTLLTSELGTMTLGDSGPQTTGTVLRADGISDTGSCQTQE
ncbi:Z-DNA-binding protein 1 isoform X2 [Peromyscus leucopus]|uniref:Z-DNA-binding protein 1 isoform X2 n=1 Tax=Peromyscus leucopus TaxID=10041 RepID=UPI0018855EB9|nr:Z-DNA-binding protein 1 isoform X2 [Peromyscus leucopus]